MLLKSSIQIFIMAFQFLIMASSFFHGVIAKFLPRLQMSPGSSAASNVARFFRGFKCRPVLPLLQMSPGSSAASNVARFFDGINKRIESSKKGMERLKERLERLGNQVALHERRSQ